MVRHFVYLITSFREETETLLPYEMYKPSATHLLVSECVDCAGMKCVCRTSAYLENPSPTFPALVCCLLLVLTGWDSSPFSQILFFVLFCLILAE